MTRWTQQLCVFLVDKSWTISTDLVPQVGPEEECFKVKVVSVEGTSRALLSASQENVLPKPGISPSLLLHDGWDFNLVHFFFLLKKQDTHKIQMLQCLFG